jgi:hypothetical protein
MQYRSFGMIVFGIAAMTGFGVVASGAQPAQDQIQVASHISVSKSPVTSLMATEHYSRYYLYVEHAGDRSVTLIDVTNIAAPKVIGEFSYPKDARDGLVSVAGTAAVVEDETGPSAERPHTVKIMDFTDAEHPQVTREFTGVTAIGRDNQRGLVFLANSEGVWILRQKLAEDPALVEAYNNYVLYSR